jgi:hypothetical protein
MERAAFASMCRCLLFDNWSGLWCVELTPASRDDVALDEFACVRWLEIDAIVAALLCFWLSLILGVSLADFLLRRGPRHSGHGRSTERKFRKHDAARYPSGIFTVVAHVRIPSVLMYGGDTPHRSSMIAISRCLFPPTVAAACRLRIERGRPEKI